MGHAFRETGSGEIEEGLAESPGKFLLLVCGKGANPFGEGFGLNETDGNRLVTAVRAALLAGDGLAGSCQIRGNIVDEGVVEAL
jgi:hypothetical protein